MQSDARTRTAKSRRTRRDPVLRLVTREGVGAAVPARQATSVRWSRVRTAQARIDAGFYDRDDVREQVMRAVLDELQPN